MPCALENYFPVVCFAVPGFNLNFAVNVETMKFLAGIAWNIIFLFAMGTIQALST